MSKFSLDRRQFTLGAAAAAAAFILPLDVLAEDALSEKILPATLRPSGDEDSHDDKTRAAMSKLSPGAQKEVEMKVDSIFRKYGDHLSDEQKSDIRRIMAETQDGLEKMRAFKLENGDQPADAFAAYRPGLQPHEAKPHEVNAHAMKGGAAKTGEKK
jgi:hypothetical protein